MVIIKINQLLVEHYRCHPESLDFTINGPWKELSQNLPYYGHTAGYSSSSIHRPLFDASLHVGRHEGILLLPCDPAQIVNHLRYECYVEQSVQQRWVESAWINKTYYLLRPLLPVSLRKYFQQVYLHGWKTIPFPAWPVDRSVDRLLEKLLGLTIQTLPIDRLPFIWFWPEGHSACAIVTHDVEGLSGRDRTGHLMDIDDAYGIKAAFQIVPEKRYPVSPAYLEAMRERGFEINVQGLTHDGRLFWNLEEFLRRAQKINHYAKEWGAQGFRLPLLYRKVDWMKHLDFCYDMSVPNVAHLDPQRGGCCTVMPYFLPGGILELPVTMTQDYSLFCVLGTYSIDLWKTPARIILEGHGLIHFIVHPDYVTAPRAQGVYEALLDYLNRLRSDHKVWLPLPREVNRWWRERSEMKLVADPTGWRIEGPGSDRARLAYARLEDNQMVYELA
jgi:hypothetical protein